MIHPTAKVHPKATIEEGARIGRDVRIGRRAQIEPGVRIERDAWIEPGATITPILIFTDSRGYCLMLTPQGDGTHSLHAGCRFFVTEQAALEHWGSPSYPGPAIGAQFCGAIRDFLNVRISA